MQLWTYQHAITLIPALAVMLVIAAVLRFTIGKKSLKIRMIPFQILAVLAFAIEIGKQVLSFEHGYDLYHIPLHFCSLFIFMLPIMAFYNGKHRQTVTAITSSISAAMVLLLLIYPDLIYGAGNIENFFTDYFSFHTVAFHNIVMFEFILIIFLDLHTPDNTKCDVMSALFFILFYCTIAAPVAQILKTNYNNFYSCNIPPLESLRISLQSSLGYGFTQVLYVLIVVVLDLAFVLLSYWVYRLFRFIIISVGRKNAEVTA